MEREKDGGARQARSLPEPAPATSDLPTMRYGRTLKEMLASGKKVISLISLTISLLNGSKNT